MSNYLIELSAVHLVLTLGYIVLLRTERQYQLMRFYLIGSIVLALTIPLFKLPVLFGSAGATAVIPTAVVSLDPVVTGPAEDTPITWVDLLTWTYVLVCMVFLYKFSVSVLGLLRLRRASRPEKCGGHHVYRIAQGKASFSFFNWIFISEGIDKEGDTHKVMLEHEKAHVALGHTYDIMFLQLFKSIFWWLPTAWFVNSEIKKIHEYQADARVLRSYSLDEYSEVLINSALRLNGLGLVSSFYDGLILKRLTAMKQETKNVSAWKLAILTVMSAALFTLFACTEDRPKVAGTENDKSNQEIFVIVEQMPEAVGGTNAFYNHMKNEISYPSAALQKSIEGRVDVQFVVEKDGSLSNITLMKGIGAGCDEAVMQAIRNTTFKPASQGGRPVRVRMVMPVLFKIEDSNGIINIMAMQPVNDRFRVTADYKNGEWSGAVYDQEGEGLPGVNVIAMGTTTGTVSGLDGSFTLKADESSDINFSFVGYENVRLNSKEHFRE